MNGERHVPVRTCVGCGRRGPRTDMSRMVRDSSGRVVLDWAGRAPGRGAYLHRSGACWMQFAGRKGIVRSLGATVDRAARSALVEAMRLKVAR